MYNNDNETTWKSYHPRSNGSWSPNFDGGFKKYIGIFVLEKILFQFIMYYTSNYYVLHN